MNEDDLEKKADKLIEYSRKRVLSDSETTPLTPEEKNTIIAVVDETRKCLQSMSFQPETTRLSDEENDKLLYAYLVHSHNDATKSNSQLGSLNWDFKSNKMLWTKEIFDIIGIPTSKEKQQVVPGMQESNIYAGPDVVSFLERIFKSDRLRILDNLIETLQTEQPFDTTFMIQSRREESQVAKWVQLRGRWAISDAIFTGTLSIISDNIMESLRNSLMSRELQAIERFNKNIVTVLQIYVSEVNNLLMLIMANGQLGIATSIDLETEALELDTSLEQSWAATALQNIKYIELIKQAAALKVECKLSSAHKVVLNKLSDKIKEHKISINFSCPECTVTFPILCYQRVLLIALTSIIENAARAGSTIVLRIGTAQFQEKDKALVVDITYQSKSLTKSMSNNDLEKTGALRIIGSFLMIVGGRMRFADPGFSFEFPVAHFYREDSESKQDTRHEEIHAPREVENSIVVNRPVSQSRKSRLWNQVEEDAEAKSLNEMNVKRKRQKSMVASVPPKVSTKGLPNSLAMSGIEPRDQHRDLAPVASNIRLAWRTSLGFGRDSIAEKYYEFRKALLPESEADLINMYIPEEIIEREGRLTITDKYSNPLHLVDHYGKKIQDVEVEIFLIKDKKKNRRTRDTDNLAAQTLNSHVYESSHHVTTEELIRQKGDLARAFVPMKLVIDTTKETCLESLEVRVSEIDDPLHVRLVAVGCGWSIAPAISEPFALKTKSMRPDRKKDFPVLSDSPKVLRKVGYAVYNHLQDREKIQSVKDILDRMDENGQSFEQRLLSELKTFSKDDFRDMMKIARGATRTVMKKWFGEVVVSSNKYAVGFFFDKKCLPVLMACVDTSTGKSDWYQIPHKVNTPEFPTSQFILALKLAYNAYSQTPTPSQPKSWYKNYDVERELPMTTEEFLAYKEMAAANRPLVLPSSWKPALS